MQIHIAGAQIPVSKEIEANVATIGRAIDYAQSVGADILLTPEGSLSGYTHQFDPQAVREALEVVTQQAREAKLGLALGTCFVEPDDTTCCNEVRFYAQDGTLLGFHTKTLTCGTMTEPSVGEINHYAVRSLRTYEFGQVRVGALICNDIWANPACTPMPDPHLSQQLAKMGARIIFHAVNGGRNGSAWSEVNWRFHEANLQMRAQAGKLWIVTVDNCEPQTLPCSAPSGVVAPDGSWAVKASSAGEQLFHYRIEIED